MIIRKASGFSLLEILIALVIGAILVSFSVMAFGDNKGSDLEKQATRLYALFKQAQDETLLRSIDLGVRIEKDHYLFYLFNYEDEKWLPLEGDDFFTKKEIPESLEVKLVVDGNTLFGGDEDEEVDIFEDDVDIFEDGQPKIEPPQIFILSSGEMNNFKVAIGWTDDDPRYFLISGNMIGTIEIEGPLYGDLRVEVSDDEFLSE